MTTKLVDALRAKYKDARSALRALGLDESLLDSEGTLLRKNADKVINHLLKRFGSTDKVLWHLAMDASMLRGEDTFEVPEGTSGIAPKVEQMPPQNMSAEDDEEWDDEPLREHLRGNGMSEDQIEKACELARNHANDMRRRSANGKDRFPVNAVRSSEREPPFRGHFGGARRPGEMPSDNWGGDPNNGQLIRHGIDYSPNRQAVDEIHVQLKRFGLGEAGCAPERFRSTTDSKPLSAKQTAQLYEMFPDMARIGTPSEDGVSIRNGTYKSRYEV